MTTSAVTAARFSAAITRRVRMFGLQTNGNLAAESDWATANLNRTPEINGLFIDFNTPAATFSDRLATASYNGAVPMITWQPSKFGATGDTYPLTNISAGMYDAYITSVAQAAAAWAGPILLRWGHEMNANWYPWGYENYTVDQYVAAWQHIHDLFQANGASNVAWVWCPNVAGATKSPAPYYPGDSFVDVVALDGYNTIAQSNAWTSPQQVFGPTITNLAAQLAVKPLLIAEVGCAEVSATWPKYNGAGASKAQWISQFVSMLNGNSDSIGFCWSEWSGKQIETSADSVQAMQVALASYWP